MNICFARHKPLPAVIQSFIAVADTVDDEIALIVFVRIADVVRACRTMKGLQHHGSLISSIVVMLCQMQTTRFSNKATELLLLLDSHPIVVKSGGMYYPAI